MTIIQRVQETLNSFPEVMWDRYIGDIDDFEMFGWIARPEDSYKDFVLLGFVGGVPATIVTSSAKYSKQFNDRLGFEDHTDCQRVEDIFAGDNVIRLKKNTP